MSDGSYRSAVQAWREHLRAGGATPWAEFRENPQPAGASDSGPAGAVQLELVRRLDSTTPGFDGLADLVLSTPAPGRGSIDVPLDWAHPRPYGAPAVDPADLSPDELVRVAVGVLDRLLPDTSPAAPSRRKPLLAKGFRVAGAPEAARLAREGMLAKGWREGSVRARRFVFGSPLADGMAQLWSTRVADGAAVPWRELWRRTTQRGLPASLRFDELLEQPGRTVPVTGTLTDIAATMRREHGVDVGPAPDLVATELIRRLNPVLAMRFSRERRREIAPAVRELVELRPAARELGRPAVELGRSGREPIRQLGVPAGARAWAEQVGGDYARNAMVDVPSDAALDLALDAIAQGWVRRVKGSG